MKKYALLLCTFLFLAFSSRAQDVITLINGTTVLGQVIQITPTTVVCADANDPFHHITVRKSGIATVQYANGSKTIYNLIGANINRKKIADNGTVHGWYFGANASGGVGTVTSHDPTYTVGASACGGGYLFATGAINQHLAIQFGIGADYYAYHVSYVNPSIFAGTSDIFAQRYATLPIRVLYLSNSKRRTGFYASAGMDFSVLVSAKDNENDFLTPYYAPFLVSPYISCGIIYRNTNARGIWMLGPFYKSSITNIYSSQQVHWDGSPFMASGNTGNIASMGVTLTFMANFGRWEQDGY